MVNKIEELVPKPLLNLNQYAIGINQSACGANTGFYGFIYYWFSLLY